MRVCHPPHPGEAADAMRSGSDGRASGHRVIEGVDGRGVGPDGLRAVAAGVTAIATGNRSRRCTDATAAKK